MERNEAVPIMFQMFPIPFTLAGAYPRDEGVSDLALQIWSNILECDIDDFSAGNEFNIHPGISVLRECHASFLGQALLKVRLIEYTILLSYYKMPFKSVAFDVLC